LTLKCDLEGQMLENIGTDFVVFANASILRGYRLF